MKNIFFSFLWQWYIFWDDVGKGIRQNIRTDFLNDITCVLIILEGFLSGFVLAFGSVVFEILCNVVIILVLFFSTLRALSTLKGRMRGRFILFVIGVFLFSYFIYVLLAQISITSKVIASAITLAGFVIVSDIISYYMMRETKAMAHEKAYTIAAILFAVGIFFGMLCGNFRPKKYDATSNLSYLEVMTGEFADDNYMLQTKELKAQEILTRYGKRPKKLYVWYRDKQSFTYFKIDDTWYCHTDGDGDNW